MAKPPTPIDEESNKPLIEIHTGRSQDPDRGMGSTGIQDALIGSDILNNIASLNTHHGILKLALEHRTLAARLCLHLPSSLHSSQLWQFKERLGIFGAIDEMRRLGLQPGVLDALNELKKSIGTSPLDPNPFGRFNLAALSALSDHQREMYLWTSLKFTALETASLVRGFDSSAFMAARNSLLGSWQSLPDLPDRFFTQHDYRAGVYREHNVDQGLIDATPEVAVELMIESGFLHGDQYEKEAVARFAVGNVSMEIRSSDPTAGAKRVLDHIELRLRSIISKKLEAAFGKRWFTECTPPDVLQNARRKREAGLKGGEDPAPLIQWTDLGDLHKIVISKKNWPTVFEELFAERDRFDADMRSLTTFRRPAAHVRPIDSPRLAELLLIAQRLESWIDEDGLWRREANAEE